ncbi:MAG TPA: glycerophosphodiester phosphodiesterase family protein [Candidatus Polarisedimenticolia bacterium]|nr:glycerophosphodiester phosphodiesterase family protein [Candidatus Polarisedimenticolia bacterium]
MTQSIRARYEAAHDDGRALLGGHRGNPAQHPENTMRSFRSAITAGCDLIECDVHLSSDGRLMVIHDHSLERTTNGSGLVRDHTAAELRRLNAGEGEHIPLLQEVVELAIGKVGLVIEIKQVPIQYPGLEEKLVAMLRQLGAVSECAVVSFHHPSIRQLREMEPKLQLGILEGARPIDPARMMREAGADVYSPHWGATDPQVVKEIHSAGGAVGVWTVDDDAAVAWCQICRPDSILTNRPVEIGPAIRSYATA